MAEGDTVHRIARRLEAALAGRRVLEAAAPNPRSPLRRQMARLAELPGGRLTRAEAKGKHLLLHFEPGLALHCHLGMRGSWQVLEPGSRWRLPLPGAWVVLSTERAEAAQFGGSRLALRSEGELRSDPRLASLGLTCWGRISTARGESQTCEPGPGVERSGKCCSTRASLPGWATCTKAKGALPRPSTRGARRPIWTTPTWDGCWMPSWT